MAAVPAGVDFTPLMTLYLTDRTTYVYRVGSECIDSPVVFGTLSDPVTVVPIMGRAEEIHKAKACGAVYAVKLYPAGPLAPKSDQTHPFAS